MGKILAHNVLKSPLGSIPNAIMSLSWKRLFFTPFVGWSILILSKYYVSAEDMADLAETVFFILVLYTLIQIAIIETLFVGEKRSARPFRLYLIPRSNFYIVSNVFFSKLLLLITPLLLFTLLSKLSGINSFIKESWTIGIFFTAFFFSPFQYNGKMTSFSFLLLILIVLFHGTRGPVDSLLINSGYLVISFFLNLIAFSSDRNSIGTFTSPDSLLLLPETQRKLSVPKKQALLKKPTGPQFQLFPFKFNKETPSNNLLWLDLQESGPNILVLVFLWIVSQVVFFGLTGPFIHYGIAVIYLILSILVTKWVCKKNSPSILKEYYARYLMPVSDELLAQSLYRAFYTVQIIYLTFWSGLGCLGAIHYSNDHWWSFFLGLNSNNISYLFLSLFIISANLYGVFKKILAKNQTLSFDRKFDFLLVTFCLLAFTKPDWEIFNYAVNYFTLAWFLVILWVLAWGIFSVWKMHILSVKKLRNISFLNMGLAVILSVVLYFMIPGYFYLQACLMLLPILFIFLSPLLLYPALIYIERHQ